MDFEIVKELRDEFVRKSKTLSLAESCTGGMLSSLITQIPGASQFFLGSLVLYSNEWKKQFLGVSSIDEFGAVSSETVLEMAHHLLEKTSSDYVAAISGIAGPDGGTAEKPVGTVWVSLGEKNKRAVAFCLKLTGNRQAIIEAAAHKTLLLLLHKIRGEKISFSI